MTTRQSSSPSTTLAGPKAESEGRPLVSIESAIFSNVQVTLQVKLGEVDLSVAELLALTPGSTLKLGVKLNEPVELHLNGTLVARGDIVAVGDHFGLRLIDVAKLS